MGPPRTHDPEPGYVLAKSILLPWLAGAFRSHFEGADNIPKTGPVIIAVNHISLFDPLIVAYAIHKNGRRPRFFAKSPLFSLPFVGWVLRSARQIRVERGSRNAVASLDHAVAAVTSGDVVVIFPEGTVPLDEEITPLPPKTGVARLALATGVDVIPCATWGGQWIWGYHVGFKPGFRKDVWVRFGRPISFSHLASRKDDPAAWDEVAKTVMDEVAVLLAGLKAAKPWIPHALSRSGRKRLEQKQARGS